ncbi:Uncharacterized membrane protein YdjX, TVP38/TMEM64 family, SNARE-associated domain [Marininema mesophilum]|uniref:TVP38/TMEM64 family membrane protein n=1 Tax=Marininema mesophilum TaxID=1048340 RepID=A0A1H2XQH9_9BACL|nr:TVP38/TMEM64 family protein [Marininema mesophilum]SDW95026.1 Uncharacterized membrane protein YdjX, TVP38/TMEM64 family, SNARE-associated domain [Marininema mesophilum]
MVIKKNLSIILLLILLALGACIFLFLDLRQLSPESIRYFVLSFGVWAPILYLLMHVMRPLFLVPAVVLAVASGITFGPWWGTILDVIGSLGGAMVAFTLARWLGKETVSRWLGSYARWEKWMVDEGFRTIFLLRLIPILPFDAVSYGAGFSRTGARDYYLGTLIGVLPGAFVFNYLGYSLHDLFSPVFFASLGGALLLAISPWLFRRFSRSFVKQK